MYSDVEWRKDVTNENLEYKDGYITIPDKPGLGIEIDSVKKDVGKTYILLVV